MISIAVRCLRLPGLLLAVLALIGGCGGGGGGGAPAAATNDPQYLVITIDVEALPNRQDEDHVDRLIYGNFPGRGRAGIVEMMDVADRHGVKLTFFLDVLEDVLYPGQIEAVARLVVARGHDLQLHTHPEVMPRQFFTRLGIAHRLTNEFTQAEATRLFDEIQSMVADWGLPPFTAYRAGGYRYSRGVVQAMPGAGLSYSYNYNIRGVSQDEYALDNRSMFRWENEVVEIPISYVDEPSVGTVRFDDFAYTRTGDPRHAVELIARFQSQWPSPNVLVMMLHSWSFLELDPGTSHFEYRDSSKVVLFEQFLASLPKNVKVVTATALGGLVARGAVVVSDRVDTADVFGE